MEANDGPTVLVILGLVGVVIGFWVDGWLWGNFAYVGVSWIIAGAIYRFAERDLTEGAFLAGLVFGVFGALIWIVIDVSRSEKKSAHWKYSGENSHRLISSENYRCGNCFWMGKPGCKRNETLINAEPCADFKFWKHS